MDVDRSLEARHGEVVVVRRILTSPLGVIAIAVPLMGLWVAVHRHQSSLAADALVGHAVAQDRPPVPVVAELAPIPGVRPSPRLRDVAGRDPALPGRPISIQDRDGHSMDALHAALQRAHAGGGQARLLFWGASHTASDLYTGYVRAALQQSLGDAGHGFVIPVPPWPAYRHQ